VVPLNHFGGVLPAILDRESEKLSFFDNLRLILVETSARVTEMMCW
jgi:hypothetical protein